MYDYKNNETLMFEHYIYLIPWNEAYNFFKFNHWRTMGVFAQIASK
jgi:hypothetical protein